MPLAYPTSPLLPYDVHAVPVWPPGLNPVRPAEFAAPVLHVHPVPQTDTSPLATAREQKSHTQRCREKVNDNIALLRHELPRPARSLKRKGEVLECAIRTIRDLLERRDSLLRRNALNSAEAVAGWAALHVNVDASIEPAGILLEFGLMYAAEHAWAVVEVWLSGTARAAVGVAVGSPALPEESSVKEAVKRVFMSQTPVWLDQYGKLSGTAIAVPVCFGMTCAAVLVLIDDKPKKYNGAVVEKLRSLTDTVLKVQQQRDFSLEDLLEQASNDAFLQSTLRDASSTLLCSFEDFGE